MGFVVQIAGARLTKRLHLLLAPKERFEPDGAGAFALNVLETSRASRFRDGITVFGSRAGSPFDGVRFHPFAKARWWEGDRNMAMARRYVNHANEKPPDLVEVYNRPVMVEVLRRGLGAVPIALHFGNDPRGMDGSRSVGDRRKLLEQCDAIVCVSDFIRRCFLDGVDHRLSTHVKVVYTGVPPAPSIPAKDDRIIYVGRVVPEKGVLELVEALARILPRHADWNAEVIGARWFGSGTKATSYEKSVARVASACNRIALCGFKPHEDVLASLNRAAMAVVPSLWDDPFPRTALEALAHGCALVCSTRGGLPEIGMDRALYIESVSPGSLADALDRLITNRAERETLQQRARNDFPFDIRRATSQLDDLRERLTSGA